METGLGVASAPGVFCAAAPLPPPSLVPKIGQAWFIPAATATTAIAVARLTRNVVPILGGFLFGDGPDRRGPRELSDSVVNFYLHPRKRKNRPLAAGPFLQDLSVLYRRRLRSVNSR
jgi:hypothetical protein